MSPETLVSSYLRRSLSQDAKVAAVILRTCPEFITDVRDERIGDFLGRIGAGTVRDETVLGWLERAKVNGARPVSTLGVRQRYWLAAELSRFAQELQDVGGSPAADPPGVVPPTPGTPSPNAQQRPIAAPLSSSPEALTVGSCACAASTVRADGGGS